MKRKTKTAALVLSLALLSMMFLFGGCTKYASQEDLQALENQKQAALSAEQRVQELERQVEELQSEIAQKERELEEKQDILRQIRG